MSNSENTANTEDSFFSTFFNYVNYYLKKSFIFILIFAIFVINLSALSLSIKCNKSEGIFFKISSALYAFMFGILYILINYYMYRIKMKNYACDHVCGNPFS
jgi:hypothetical protein|tara:strand:- start:156 stop:461 length:306 start_codon:yes stop_codon:yes gene_type:complete